MFQFAVLLLQVANQLFKAMERQRLIAEGERRQIAKQIQDIARTSRLSVEVREYVGRMTDDEVDAALRGDFRD
jgi:uncharacterized protein YjbJ (UPF0337 family)